MYKCPRVTHICVFSTLQYGIKVKFEGFYLNIMIKNNLFIMILLE